MCQCDVVVEIGVGEEEEEKEVGIESVDLYYGTKRDQKLLIDHCPIVPDTT